jgi:hypothetical protein
MGFKAPERPRSTGGALHQASPVQFQGSFTQQVDSRLLFAHTPSVSPSEAEVDTFAQS